MQKRLIPAQKSLIPACDFTNGFYLEKLIVGTAGIPEIGAYKIGCITGLSLGLADSVAIIRAHSAIPIIYDHQKAATDNPELGKNFAQMLRAAKIDSAILFPFSGRDTEDAWIKALQDADIHPIVGAEMTHNGFFAQNDGYIVDDAPDRIFERALALHVRDFVVPGNRPERVATYRRYFERMLGSNEIFTLYAPGFITQGGSISETDKVAGSNWHPIVGRALYGQFYPADIHAKALELIAEL